MTSLFPHRLRNTVLAAVVGSLVLATGALAQGLVDPQDMPGPLKDVGFDQQLGKMLPLDTPFRDEYGRDVELGDYFGDKPVVMVFVYYNCPMLCPMTLNGLAKSLGVLQFDVGNEFDVVAISIDPSETPEMAQRVERTTVKRYGRPETVDGWHFLLGNDEAVQRITEAAGFRYVYLEDNGVTPEGDKRNDYAHASGIIVATPEGQMAQYFYGIEYPPKDVRLALVEASSNRIGSVVDQILLYCFRYDPSLGKYTAIITRILQLTGIIFVLVLGTFLWIMWRRDQAMIEPRTSTLGAASR